MKFNVDGASKGNLGPRGIGRVLRNDQGVVLGHFSKSIGGCGHMKLKSLPYIMLPYSAISLISRILSSNATLH